MDSNLPVPNNHCEVLYRQTFNTYGAVDTIGLTQDNRTISAQAIANTGASGRLYTITNKGILAGSVVAVVGSGVVGPCSTNEIGTAGDSTTLDPVVGIAVNDAVGNPYESSSAVASQKVVYAHGTGTVIKTDIYEYYEAVSTTSAITYTAGDLMYASQDGLLTNANGLKIKGVVGKQTPVGILLVKPTSTDPFMVVQLKI